MAEPGPVVHDKSSLEAGHNDNEAVDSVPEDQVAICVSWAPTDTSRHGQHRDPEEEDRMENGSSNP